MFALAVVCVVLALALPGACWITGHFLTLQSKQALEHMEAIHTVGGQPVEAYMAQTRFVQEEKQKHQEYLRAKTRRPTAEQVIS